MNSYKNINLKFNREGIEYFSPNIYKFRDWNNIYHKNILIKQELFASEIEALNDPFDGSVIVNHKINLISKDDVKNLLGLEDNMPVPLDDIIKNARESLILKMDNELNDNIKKTGILSFSSIKNNILLWSHYANGHKGFAVGFDTKKLSSSIGELKLQSFIKEINYTKYYPEIKLDHNLFKKNDDLLLFKAVVHSLTTKSENWSYEKEVRILTFAKNNVLINFPKDCIKEIILGFKMSESDEKEIINICKSSYPQANIFKCKKAINSYSILFEKII